MPAYDCLRSGAPRHAPSRRTPDAWRDQRRRVRFDRRPADTVRMQLAFRRRVDLLGARSPSSSRPAEFAALARSSPAQPRPSAPTPPPPAPTTPTRPPPSAPPTPATPTATASTASRCPARASRPARAGRRPRHPPRPLSPPPPSPPPRPAAPRPPASSRSPSPRPSTPTSAATSAPPCAAAGRARWCSTGRGADARRERLLARHPDPRRLRPRRVPARGRPRQRQGPAPRHAPARLEGRRALRPELREPLARLDARDQAAALLRRHPLPLRLLLAGAQCRAGVCERSCAAPVLWEPSSKRACVASAITASVSLPPPRHAHEPAPTADPHGRSTQPSGRAPRRTTLNYHHLSVPLRRRSGTLAFWNSSSLLLPSCSRPD